VGLPDSDLLAHYMKLCAMATKENKMYIKRENLSVLAKVTKVSDVTYGPRSHFEIISL
jgi:hypothetical protein